MIFVQIHSSYLNKLALAVVLLTSGCGVHAAPYVHPGIHHTKQQLDTMKGLIDVEPHRTGWKQLLAWKGSSLTYQARPFAVVERGAYLQPNIGGYELMDDGNAAYSHALQWYITGKEEHAKKSVEILNAWVNKCTKITGADDELLAGITGSRYVNAAEILRYSYPGWSQADVTKFSDWLSKVFWPLVKDGGSDQNNWDSACIATGISIGAFQDDDAKFTHALNRLKKHIPAYIMTSGQTRETCRDSDHSQMGLGWILDAAVIAYNQGQDMLAANENRISKGMEYVAMGFLGIKVTTNGCEAKYRTYAHPIFYRSFVHYHYVKKLEMPYSKEILLNNINPPDAISRYHVMFDQLTSVAPGVMPNPPAGKTVNINLSPGWNMISLPVTPASSDPAKVLSSIANKYEAIYAYNPLAGSYTHYFPGEASNTIQKLEPGRGYWIYMSSAGSVSVTGTAASKALSIEEGWNLVGYANTTESPIASAVNTSGGRISVVYWFNASANSYEGYAPPEDNTLKTLTPGRGYWVYSESRFTWTLP
jgi:hypothetical protein